MAIRFNTYSPFEEKDRKLFYQIIILSHAIEKGLSFPNLRPLFGREKIELIMRMIQEFNKSFSLFPLEMSSGALQNYVEVHRAMGVIDPFLETVDKFARDKIIFDKIEPKGGIKKISFYPDPENKFSNKMNLQFLESRFSCRVYESGVISEETIDNVVTIAQQTPSQCNRQSVRLHCFQEKSKIEELLLLQGGAAGFYEGVYNLFIVTSEATAWGGFGQRNQGYVDGGLFSMGLLLACHAHNIGTCALNLAVGNSHENKIKKIANIHPRERLIMMIAFGYYPVEGRLKAAMSPRLSVQQVLRKHSID
ncbi:MAG: nitroreductase family protein [Candidatus Competibacteraceae bacterium]|nr:MAG: nitroreductase family protein [Candidatus Competibacteraceae bacterium]